MKTFILGLYGLLLISLIPATVNAQFFGDFTYSSDGSTVTIAEYTGPGGAVTVPDTITGLPVRAIGNSAFYARTNVIRVNLPSSVTGIGDLAFSGCSGLTEIQLPAGLTRLGSGAFQGCTELIHVVVPGGVANLGPGAFFGCTSLVSVALFPGLRSIEQSAFSGCARLAQLSIPATVTNVGNYAFAGCLSLTSVAIPASVETIDALTFQNCPGLLAISVDAANPNYTSVDGVLFNALQSVLLRFPGGRGGGYAVPNGVRSVADWAFEFSPNLTDVICPGSVTNLGQYAFASCGQLASVILPEGLLTIGPAAFGSCTNLTHIAIPASVRALGGSGLDLFRNAGGVFARCTRLADITVDAANTIYGSQDGVLFDKERTRLIRFPPAKPGSYEIPGTVTNILGNAFADCIQLTNLIISGRNEFLGQNAVAGCNSLRSVVLDSGVTRIGANAFLSCSNLAHVTLADSVTAIGAGTFMNCVSLANLTLPASLTNVASQAFVNCANLQGLFFKGNRPQAGSSVLNGTNAIVYYLPGATGWSAAFAGRPTRLWNPVIQTTSPHFGLGPDGFGFVISGTTNIPVVIEGTSNSGAGSWVPVASVNLTNGAVPFRDATSIDRPHRFYRLRSP